MGEEVSGIGYRVSGIRYQVSGIRFTQEYLSSPRRRGSLTQAQLPADALVIPA
ncbi:MAG: hypothetical protein NTV01_21220 [Bacteroidia bacterium]|nr:hypothetical protein [Bacteroidia bacterium]